MKRPIGIDLFSGAGGLSLGFEQAGFDVAAAVLNPSKENIKRLKGAKGEAQGSSGMFLFLPSDYIVLNDLLLPTPNGTSQVDHVVVSNYGIFAIESKNIAGTIYGSANDKDWTVCRGTARFRFYNPMRQNAGHIKALMAVTLLPESLFHSLVFFWSEECTFGTPMPENVLQMGLCNYIKSKRKYLMSNKDVRVAIDMIESARLKSAKANMDAHIAKVKQWRY